MRHSGASRAGAQNHGGDTADAAVVWNEEFNKGGIEPGMVVATADFLFEAGQFLHAADLRFQQPRSGALIHCTSELPPDLADVLASLEVAG